MNIRRASIPMLIVILLTIVASAMAACSTQGDAAGTATQQANTTPASPTGPANFVAAIKKILPSVVVVHVLLPQGMESAGTGWAIDKDIVVTNNHVISNATSTSSIEIVLDGKTYKAQNVQASPQHDLAVIKVGTQDLTPATLGDSSALEIGQPVAAVGNALDLGIIMTGGWVSRLNRTITYQNNLTLGGLIETDATINPGNSGGPLVTTDGYVVGITNASLVSAGSDQDIEGIDYAISINEAKPVLDKLISQLP